MCADADYFDPIGDIGFKKLEIPEDFFVGFEVFESFVILPSSA